MYFYFYTIKLKFIIGVSYIFYIFFQLIYEKLKEMLRKFLIFYVLYKNIYKNIFLFKLFTMINYKLSFFHIFSFTIRLYRKFIIYHLINKKTIIFFKKKSIY